MLPVLGTRIWRQVLPINILTKFFNPDIYNKIKSLVPGDSLQSLTPIKFASLAPGWLLQILMLVNFGVNSDFVRKIIRGQW
jgi:hypothetical protein